MHLPILDRLSKPLPYKLLQGMAKTKVLPLFYHLVGEKTKLSYARNLYTIPTKKEFEKDLDFLLSKYAPINLQELIKYKHTGKLPNQPSKKACFFLSFDDGLRQCEETIAPILLKKGIPATFFLNSAFIDNHDFIHRFKTNILQQKLKEDTSGKLQKQAEHYFKTKFKNQEEASEQIMSLRFPDQQKISELEQTMGIDTHAILKEKKPYMTKAQVQSLVNNGFTIGAHGVQHPEFTKLSEDEQISQVKGSIEDITQWFKINYSVFAFPFTDYGITATYFERLKKEVNPDLTFGCAGLKHDTAENHVQRISLDDRGQPAKERLKTEYLYYNMKRLVNKNVLKRT